MTAPLISDQPVDRVRRIQAAGVALLLVCTPLALGGVASWTRGLMVAAVALLVALEWIPRTLTGHWPDRWERAWLLVWVVVTGIVALQLVPLPSSIASFVGPYPKGFRELADVPIVRLSPTPIATSHYWAVFTCYWVVAWMVARFQRREVARLAAALTALAAFEALYGTYALAHDLERVLGIWPKRHYAGDATGTYVNHNHFAGLLALCWPLGLSWILFPGSGGREKLPPPVRQGLAFVFSLLLGTAIVSSHSRLGMVAAFGGLATWMGLSFRSGTSRGLSAPWVQWVIPATALAGAVWFGAGILIERFMHLTEHGERLVVWNALLELPAQTWVLGAGAGSFPDVFKTVQPVGLPASYLHVHNDWLEFLFDFGLLGAGASALVGAVWWRRVRPERFNALQTGAIGGLVAIAIHSVGDFNLQVPGTALAFWAAVGIATNRKLAVPRRSRRERPEFTAHR